MWFSLVTVIVKQSPGRLLVLKDSIQCLQGGGVESETSTTEPLYSAEFGSNPANDSRFFLIKFGIKCGMKIFEP